MYKPYAMQDVKMPAVHVTNYQQYVNGAFLQDAIANSLDPEMDAKLPENLYISVAYIGVRKHPRRVNVYTTRLVLSIKGDSHIYALQHSNADLYLAHVGLQTNQYSTTAAKDNHIRLLNQAFEAVVFMRAGKITEDLINGYKNQ